MQVDVGRGCAADCRCGVGKGSEGPLARLCVNDSSAADPLRLAAEKKKAFFASTLDPRSLVLAAQTGPTEARDYSMTDGKFRGSKC